MSKITKKNLGRMRNREVATFLLQVVEAGKKLSSKGSEELVDTLSAKLEKYQSALDNDPAVKITAEIHELLNGMTKDYRLISWTSKFYNKVEGSEAKQLADKISDLINKYGNIYVGMYEMRNKLVSFASELKEQDTSAIADLDIASLADDIIAKDAKVSELYLLRSVYTEKIKGDVKATRKDVSDYYANFIEVMNANAVLHEDEYSEFVNAVNGYIIKTDILQELHSQKRGKKAEGAPEPAGDSPGSADGDSKSDSEPDSDSDSVSDKTSTES